jgi:hypothetical protein
MALALRVAGACPGLDPGAFAFAILQTQSRSDIRDRFASWISLLIRMCGKPIPGSTAMNLRWPRNDEQNRGIPGRHEPAQRVSSS